ASRQIQRDPTMPQSNVVEFSAFAAAAAKLSKNPSPLADYRAARIAKQKAKLEEAETAPETLTATCRNGRLRLSRRDAWWAARRLTEYWRARLDWQSALSLAQEYGIADSNTY